MFWNYQHNHRGGWNGMPFNGFNQGQFNYHNQFPHRYPPHQAFGRPIPIVFLPPPHDQYFHHAYTRYPPHQVLRPIVPTVVPPLPHTQGMNGNPPHKAPRTTIPAAISHHQTPKPTIPAKVSPHKTIEPTIPAANPPHQTPEPTIPDKVSLDKTIEPTIPAATPPHQTPKPTVPAKVSPDKTIEPTMLAATPPHQTPKTTVPAKVSPDKTIEPTIPAATPPHQTPKPTVPAKVSPDKTLEPTIPEVVPVQQLPANLVCEICDVPLPQKQLEEHKKGKRHQRKVQEQIDHLPIQKTSNGHEAKHTPAIVSPHKTPEPTIPDVVPIQQLPTNLVCEICDIPLPRKQLEGHKKGKRHRRKVQEQFEYLKRQKSSNGHEATPNSEVSPVVQLQPKKVPNSMESRHAVKNVSFKGSFSNSQNRHKSPVVPPMKVLKSKKIEYRVENVSFKGPFFNSKYKESSVKGSERKQEDNIGAKDWRFEVETVSPIFKSKNVPTEGSERKPLDSAGVKDRGFKRKIGEAKVAEGKYMKMNNEIRKPMKSSRPEVNDLSISVRSLVQAPELTPSSKGKEHQSMCFKVETVSPIFKNKNVPTEGSERKPLDNAGAKDRGFKRKIGEAKVAEGKYMKMNNEIRNPMKSSKPEVNALSISVKSLVQAPELTPSSKGKEHDEIQNPIEEKNDQNQSTPTELQASVVSQISSGTEDMSCHFAAIVVAQPEKHDLQTEMLEGKDHNEIQCKTIIVSNDHQQSTAVHAPAGSNINSQTEDLNSDSPAIAIEPQSFTQSDAIACCESQHPAKETAFQTLPSVLMELDVPSGAVANTETVGESFIDEAKMNVLATELGITQLSQVSVCLKCGDEGFEEALVYCNKCQIYALHRYCLDGPVVINDDVIWFCEDCQETVADTSSQQQCPESEVNMDPQPTADPIWRGRLHLSNQSFGTVDGLLAHASSLACSQVREEARLFPEVLSANLLQRSTVWPKSFIEFGTDPQSIALYFFPETESVERVFDKLVEDMITKDLAITTMVENAELLIFPSTVLPIQYKRFKAKYYLWGVFRAKKTSPKTDDVVSEEDNSPIINNNSPSNTLGTSGSNGSSCASNH